jgi:hypothetical protein
VLVVDDESHSGYLRTALTAQGFAVYEAHPMGRRLSTLLLKIDRMSSSLIWACLILTARK